MKTTRLINEKDAIQFFNTSANTMDDSYGFGELNLKDKTVSFDFNTVLLLRFGGLFADTIYKINAKYFDNDFKDILNSIVTSTVEYGDYSYIRIIEDDSYSFTIKTTRVNDDSFELFFMCIEKLLETENQLNLFGNVMGSGKKLFTGSTWWVDDDKYLDRFFSSDSGPLILGIPLNPDMHYCREKYNQVREKAKIVSELYEESIMNEIASFDKVKQNKSNYAGARTPAITFKDEVVWVETYGKCLLRYKNGDTRIFVANDIYVTDVYEENTNLNTITKLINIGLENSKVGVWFHQRHFLEGKYYFTESYQKLMSHTNIYKDDNFTIMLNEQIEIMEELNNGYESYLHNFRKVHNSIYTEHLNKYKMIIPNKLQDDDLRWIEVRGTVIERDDDGHVMLFVGVNVDVTENIIHQNRIQYLANNDILTDTRNRNYFEQFINETLPKSYTVIVFDLDGLKLTNDAFGHQKGDLVIKKLADILKLVYSDNLFVSRIGGDEFAVLLNEIDSETLTKLNNNLEKNILEFNISSNIEMNVSKGSKTVIDNEMEFEKAFVQAENIMYRRKLNNRSSRKSKVLDSILETLNQKTEETKEHSDRLAILATKTLQSMNYTRESELEDIQLLAKVHDIGKITIDDHILKKPGKLTTHEFEIIKKHSEAGYKIIRNITDSDDVCNGVLLHHERYDGKGYPQGLLGDEIPLFARVISVVDSFDAMTNDRVYRPKMSKKEAINEIILNTGTQFDPKVVKAFLKANFGLDESVYLESKK